MNFQWSPKLTPLKVLIVNPLIPASQLLEIKILSGAVFGGNQLIDLILLVYANEKESAEVLKLELDKCAFKCTNSIAVSSDLPSVTDAHVFCFMTYFPNPNDLDLKLIEKDDELFDMMYLLVKVANNLTWPEPQPPPPPKLKRRMFVPPPKPIKTVFMTDGLVSMDIIKSLSKNIPPDMFFCPTPIPSMAKTILGDYLKAPCNNLNDLQVWGANDEVFHVEIEKPIVLHDDVRSQDCDWDMISKDILKSFNYDQTQFSPSWLKKEFIQKIVAMASKNPYGGIYKADEFAKSLKTVWQSRTSDGVKVYGSLGVISDGSLSTRKGLPYVLPVVFSGDSWRVNTKFEEESHLKLEIKRINKVVQENHKTVVSCFEEADKLVE